MIEGRKNIFFRFTLTHNSPITLFRLRCRSQLPSAGAGRCVCLDGTVPSDGTWDYTGPNRLRFNFFTTIKITATKLKFLLLPGVVAYETHFAALNTATSINNVGGF